MGGGWSIPRCCHLIYGKVFNLHLRDVLHECAEVLDLDVDQVIESGALIYGVEVLRDPNDLEEGIVHEVTLVMS